MNRIEFAIITGHPAVQDDMARVNCKNAGKLGHKDCGICAHGVPKFIYCEKCYEKKGGL